MNFSQLMGIGAENLNPSLELLYKSNRLAYEEIKTLVSKNAILPFIGAGFSAAIYPTWKQFLTDTAELFPNCKKDLRSYLDEGDFEGAADVLCEEMVDFAFRQRISAVFSRDYLEENKEKLSYERKMLRRLFRGNILTTNYDKVIEMIFEDKLIVLCPHMDYIQPLIEKLHQLNAPAIIKLHGDVDDVYHAVITSSDYITHYETSELRTPLVQVLTEILRARPVLFLGCSLSSDRTLQVLSSCTGSSRTYFALVELPVETHNKDYPFLPNIIEKDGRENTRYRERRQFLAEHHIKCIWYPNEMYDAVDILLKQLCTELYPESVLAPLSPMFQNEREIIGRDKKIDEIVDALNQGNKIIYVSGLGGIGKTEICRCAVKKYLTARSDVLAFYDELYDVQTISTFCSSIADALKLDSLPKMTGTDECFAWLSDAIERQYAGKSILLYFDNFEDVWLGLNRQESERIKLLQWLNQSVLNHMSVLISGRDSLRTYDFRISFHTIEPLDSGKQDDHKLFNLIYTEKGGNAPTQGPEYTELLQKLDGHPLTIVLVATCAAGVPNWKFALDVWATTEIHGANKHHNSLRTALAMSWKCICEDLLCVNLWGIMALSIDEVEIAVLRDLFTDEGSKWEDALTHLRDVSLVTWSNNKIKMLSPIKKTFFQQADKSMIQQAFKRYFSMITRYVEKAHIEHMDRAASHSMVIKMMLQILHVLTYAIDENMMNDTAKELCYDLEHYYNYCDVYAVNFLEKLRSHAANNADCRLTTFASVICGDLQGRLGKNDQAMQLYQSAQEPYRTVGDNRGLANVLKSMGDLQRQLNENDQAMQLYQRAKELYRAEQDNLGLANVLKSMGNLQSRSDKINQAMQLYQRAQKLYRAERANLGLADVLQSMGDLQRRLEKDGQALQLYQSAKELYRDEQDNRGLANVLKSMGDLQRRMGKNDQAMQFYQNAQELYRTERDNLGRANVLKSMGDLQRRLEKDDQAMQLYQSAQELYRAERANLGLANVLKSMGDLQRRLGKNDQVMQFYQNAQELYRAERANLGLANVLQSMGDLQSWLGKYDQAMQSYLSAEELYRVERINEGLANVLKSMGNLQRRMDEDD